MWMPPHFAMNDADAMRRLLRAHPLATIVTFDANAGLSGTHAPVVAKWQGETLARLEFHFARANAHWKTLEGDVLAVFQGAEHYITPDWYATKRETGKVVPTWNYEAVHVRGVARVMDDPVWLRRHVGELTDNFEASRDTPWGVSDAPTDYLGTMLRGIVGVEVTVTGVDAKLKASQNRADADRAGVVEGLRGERTTAGTQMADLVVGKPG